jgi:glycosyltransferase involved in cell wall biosynthesis
MRIGFFNGYSIWGGGEKWHYEMAKYCQERGDEVFLYTPIEGELSSRGSELGVTIRDVQITKSSYYNLVFYKKLQRRVRRDKLDVLVFNSFRDVRAAALAVKFAGVKKVIFRCGMPVAPKQSISYRLSFAFGIDYFVPISEAVREVFSVESPKLISEEKCHPYIANGINLTEFSFVGDTSKAEEPVILGNASRLSIEKGFEILLPALKILKERGHNFTMRIAGSGDEELKLKELTKKLGLNDQVEYLGHIDDVATFIKTIDICAFTSRFEGTARTMIEAMACGKPVVAFNTSSMKEVVIHEECGLLAEPFSEVDFANNLEKLILDSNLRENFGQSGRKRVEEKFDKVKNFAHWYNFLKEE